MQIKALLGSLHVIEVRRLSVQSVDNISSLTLQDVMNRRNISGMCVQVHAGMSACITLGYVQYVCVCLVT